MPVSPKRSVRLLRIAGISLLVAAAVLILGAVLDPYGCRMAEGVSLGGLDVAGMTWQEAGKALSAASASTLQAVPVTIELPEQTLVLRPEEAGLRLRRGRLLLDAYLCGRLGQRVEEKTLGAYLSWDEQQLLRQLEAYAASQDTTLTQPVWKLEGEPQPLGTKDFSEVAPGQTLSLTLGIPEQHLDIEGILAQVRRVYDFAFTASYTLTPDVTPQTLPETPDLAAIAREVQVEPVSDSLDLKTFALVPGSWGLALDLEEARRFVETGDFGQTLRLPLEAVRPEILGDEVYFRDVLGACETRHNDNANRNENLRLICQILNGHVVEPGEEFSFNEVVGERTKERGFKPAPAYSGNRLIQDYGGGACQTSTTLYNCLLLSDLEILERNCHGALVGYVAKGLDAAVNWATKTDLRFRNNGHFPVKIQAELSEGYVRMQLLGTDEKDYYIKMESTSSETDLLVYANSYKVKYSKQTNEQISRDLEARSSYYKGI